MDLLNIMVLLSIKNQAGPAQDPWPPKPKPSRSGPGPLAPQAKPKPVRSRTLGQKRIWALWAPGTLDHGPYGPQGPWAQN